MADCCRSYDDAKEHSQCSPKQYNRFPVIKVQNKSPGVIFAQKANVSADITILVCLAYVQAEKNDKGQEEYGKGNDLSGKYRHKHRAIMHIAEPKPVAIEIKEQ